MLFDLVSAYPICTIASFEGDYHELQGLSSTGHLALCILAFFIFPFGVWQAFQNSPTNFGSSLFTHRYEERFDGVLLAHKTTLVDEDSKDDESEGKGKKKVDDKSEVEGKKKVDDKSEVEGKKEVKILRAKILNGLVPYFGVRVHANLLIFSPKPDMILGKLLYFFATPL